MAQFPGYFRGSAQNFLRRPAVLHIRTSYIRKVFPADRKINRAIVKKELQFLKYMLE
jgi:hypothetical protein